MNTNKKELYIVDKTRLCLLHLKIKNELIPPKSFDGF